MTICENFIYTSSPLLEQKGYQVIAKSSGITKEIISELDNYMYPIGLSARTFKESKSMLLLKNDLIAYTKVKNIGYGYDKRPDTLYNHTIIIRKRDYEKYLNDSRIFDEYFLEDPSREGYLPFIRLEPKKIGLTTLKDIQKTTVEVFLYGLFKSEKIAILDTEKSNLIPELISMAPPSLRLVSFSTLVPEPNRQPKYEIIQTERGHKLSLKEKNFRVIDVGIPSQLNENELKEPLAKAIKNFVSIISAKERYRIEEIHENFEKILSDNKEEKFILVTNFDKFQYIEDKILKKKYAYDVFNMLEIFDTDTAFEYILKIKDFLKEEDLQEYLPQLEINRIINNTKEESINLHNLESMFWKLSFTSTELRLQLLKKLVEIKPDQFLKNGVELLLDARFSSYRKEIMRIFVENKILHKCIFDIVGKKNEQERMNQQAIFELLIEQALDYNNSIIPKLLISPIFDFNNQYDSMQFKKILEDVLKSKNFRESIDINDMLTSINQLEKKFNEIIENVPDSGTSGTTESNQRELLEIIKIMKDFLTSLSHWNKSTPQIKQELNKEKESLEEFLRKHKLPERKGWRPWRL